MREGRVVIRVDIVSDVMCPWCVIGYRQLAAAARDTGAELEIHWHPFELNPDMEPEGENLTEHVGRKYGFTPEASAKGRERITALGAELGFPFRFTADMRIWNTFAAHQLIDWAGERGRAHDVKMGLFSAHFTHRRNVSDLVVLSDVAEEVGLGRAEALAMLEGGERAETVRENEALWVSRGVGGVPTMVFSERYIIDGARGVETYASILDQLKARAG